MRALVERRGALLAACQPVTYGRIRRMVGTSIEVGGLDAAIGDCCLLHGATSVVPAEVVALGEGAVTCLPLGETRGLRAGALAEATGGPLLAPVGDGLLGRVLDGLGRPIDGGGALVGVEQATIDHPAPHPLRRRAVSEQLALGVRAIDAMLPCGKGQRLGIFAGSGVGKSSLLSMITRNTAADAVVVALVGERGREVAELVERDLASALERAVVVVATSDAPALVRLRAAFLATRIAEWFRDRGRDVLLLMDSLTRCAMAQREVGLAAGEPPATRGYPPSVFGLLPRLLERAGTDERGSITGLYTVLVEGDDMNEPIADASRSILDGHLQLSRALAESGHYPAIDVLGSVSRVAPAITDPSTRAAALAIRRLLAAYRDARDLVEIGAYVPGTNPLVDAAIAAKPEIDRFCRQGLDEASTAAEAREGLARLAACYPEALP
ncbi:MAG TPA: FliI/YscN family ATPase [Acidimicrobiales bacterium]|nr:FliI/YscN family ATPase [Acidimicrobiales bacterium]